MKNLCLVSSVIFVLCSLLFANAEELEAKPQPLFEEIPNQHLGLGCESCHKQKPAPTSTEEEIRTFANTFEFDEVGLCKSCHKKGCLHPTGTDVVCSSCHNLHTTVGNFHLLRGFPEGAFDFEPKFKNRESFCRGCHRDGPASWNPHKGDSSSCGFCHAEDQNVGAVRESPLRQETESICHFCHDELSSEHYKDANPYPDLGKNPGCTTCHDVHGYSKKGYFINQAYEDPANESKRTNPHLRDAFCLTCHTEEPEKGVPNIRFNGNVIDACMHCHKDEFKWRTADFHPVNVSVDIPGRHKPKNLVLFDEKVTCLTCHLVDCQVENKKEVKKINKVFLRGGPDGKPDGSPYQHRSDICFECHERDAYAKYNVHDQIDSRGIVREGVCLYCHRVQPDRKLKTQKQDSSNLVAPMIDLCVRCHRDKFHPGQKDHIKPVSADMQKRKSVYEIEQNVFFPMSEEGNVTCVTCHNPHEKGIIPWGAGAKGADEPDKLRLAKKDGLLCQVCHTARGLK